MSTIKCFSVSSILFIMLMWFLRSVTCFMFVILFTDLSVSLSSISSGSVILLFSCCFRNSNLQIFAKCIMFLQLCHVGSGAGLLWLGFHISSLHYLQVLSFGSCFGLSFGLAPYIPVYFTSSIGSSLTSFCRFDVSSSRIVLFLFFLSHVFCCLCSTTFRTCKSSSFSNSPAISFRWKTP